MTRVVAREGLFGWALLAVRQGARSWFFAYDEVEIHHSRSGPVSRSDWVSSIPALKVSRFSPGLVTEAALECPGYLTPEILRQFRKRVRRGGVGVIGFRRDRLVHLAWVGNREERGERGGLGRVIPSETGEEPRGTERIALDEATCRIGFCARGRSREASPVC